MAKNQDCSTKSFAWLDVSDQKRLCWKTSQRCLLEEWATYSESWPRSGLMQNGTAYRLPPLVRRISATEFSFWVTPTVDAATERKKKYAQGGQSLSYQVKYGTPTATTRVRSKKFRNGRTPNPAEVAQDEKQGNAIRWPTPVATDAIKMPSGSLSRAVRPDLQQSFRKGRTAEIVPTAAASDGKGAPKNRYRGSETYKSNLFEYVRTSESSGQLNPTWVEWLMGFPEGWTELKD